MTMSLSFKSRSIRPRSIRRPWVRHRSLAAASLLAACGVLAGCVYDAAPGTTLPDLSRDATQPELALLDHVLRGYFVGAGSGVDRPTTCASLAPEPLGAAREQELIVRFVRLAPLSRCEARNEDAIDSITGETATVVRVYEFACTEPTRCTAWATVPGRPATRHAMHYEQGAWRFTSDRRIIAE